MKRVKILASVMTMCVAIAALVFGVYAATKLEFDINSSLSFSAPDDVLVDIVGKVRGAEVDYNYQYTHPTTLSNRTAPKTWELGDLKFNSEFDEPIVIYFEITNYTNAPISAIFSNVPDSTTNVTVVNQSNSYIHAYNKDEDAYFGGTEGASASVGMVQLEFWPEKNKDKPLDFSLVLQIEKQNTSTILLPDANCTFSNGTISAVTNYSSSTSTVAFPKLFNNTPVTSITANLNTLTSPEDIVIPSSVTSMSSTVTLSSACKNLSLSKNMTSMPSISSSATDLNKIIIPSAVTNLTGVWGSTSSSTQNSIKRLYVTETVLTVGDGAPLVFNDTDVRIHFGDNTTSINVARDMDFINIPEKVTSLKFFSTELLTANGYGTRIKSYYVSPLNTTFSSIDGSLYTKDETTLCASKMNGPYYMPETVTTINSGAFGTMGTSGLYKLEVIYINNNNLTMNGASYLSSTFIALGNGCISSGNTTTNTLNLFLSGGVICIPNGTLSIFTADTNGWGQYSSSLVEQLSYDTFTYDSTGTVITGLASEVDISDLEYVYFPQTGPSGKQITTINEGWYLKSTEERGTLNDTTMAIFVPAGYKTINADFSSATCTQARWVYVSETAV